MKIRSCFGCLARGLLANTGLRAAVIVAAGLAAVTAPAQGQTLTTRRVVSGLVRPIYVTHAPNDLTRIFIIEKQGRIRIAQLTNSGAYTLLPASFLDIDPIITGGTSTGSEQGLLGLAFHPNYPTDPRFFVNYTATSPAGATVIAAYTVSAGNPNVANTTGDIIMTFSQPQANHNGGWIGFAPNGLLYISSGDGGNANDAGTGHTEPGGNSQDITSNRLGKILRIDISGDDFPADTSRDYRIPASNPHVSTANDAEIWAHGLRNPWRPSIDRGTGDLWIADVGQNNIEEINFQPSTGPGTAGRNYGWRCYEGNTVFNNDAFCTAVGTAGLTFPIYTYTHSVGCSITGGYVYRGCAIPSLQGTYFFADYCTAFIQTFRYSGGVVTGFTDRTAELAPGGGFGIASITSFGEDAAGELYICDQDGGEVFKIVPRAGTFTDCNADSVPDTCQSLTPQFTSNPGTTSQCPGRSVNFSAAASNGPASTYTWQWQAPGSGTYVTISNGAVAGLGTVSNAGTAALTISNLALAANASSIRAVATSTCGTNNSTPASLFVVTAGCPCNPADIAGSGATYSNGAVDIGPDYQLGIDDFVVFLAAFSDEAGCPGVAPCNPADIAGPGATYANGAVDVGPDGELSIDDFVVFLAAFSDGAGCP